MNSQVDQTPKAYMKNKKLLVLGGLAQVCDIVENAKQKGIHVIVTDNIACSPAKIIANESWEISITDVDAIVEKCTQANVDGVMNYCIDPGQKPYYEICERLKLPCYGTREQFDALTSKDIFKEICINNDVDVVPGYVVYDEESLIDSHKFEFPVVIKPADSRASKGISVCQGAEDLPAAIAHALEFSRQRVVIAEKFMSGPEVAVKYFVSEGKIALSSMSDIHTYYEGGKRIYIGSQTFPSKFFAMFLETADEKLRRMIRSIDIRNGPLSFSGFVEDGKFRFIDPSFRLGGAQDWIVVENITGVNIANCLTQFALTGSVGNPELVNSIDCRIGEKASAMLYFLGREGTIGRITGVEQVSKFDCVIGFHQCHFEGSVIDNPGTSDHVILRFLLSCDNVSDLKECIRAIQSEICIFDIDNRSMKLDNFSVECF